MKRSLDSSDSLGALMTICPTRDEHSPRNKIYSRDFQSMLDGYDEEGCFEESAHVGEKKRRLSVVQVKALEKNFEVENKLEPDRKVKLAQELGLQPRQVAVWFQNRRARWKTKQLERDYGLLKTRYDSLKANYESLQHDNEALLKEIRELRAKQSGESNVSVKEEVIVPTDHNKSLEEQSEPAAVSSLVNSSEPADLNHESLDHSNGGATLFPDLKDGSSDSDSSAILNEDILIDNSSGSNSLNSGVLESQHLLISSCSSPSSSSMDCFDFSKSTYQHHQYVKMEEHDFFTADEACNFFSDDVAPTLHWYTEQWN